MNKKKKKKKNIGLLSFICMNEITLRSHGTFPEYFLQYLSWLYLNVLVF